MSILNSAIDRTRTRHIFRQNIRTLRQITLGKQLVPYIGLTGHNNLGDEVMYEAHQKLFPRYDLITYRKDAEIMQRFASLRGKPFKKIAILGGGTLINDGDVWLNRTAHLLNNGYRTFCIGTGAESSEFYAQKDEDNTLLKDWVKILNKFEFVGVRGPQSKSILERAGATNITIVGDPALSLTPDHIDHPHKNGVMGITYGDVPGNPMWGDRHQFREVIKSIIRTALQDGMTVRLLPVWDIDLPSNRSLLQEINHPNCTMVETFDSFDSFSKTVKECDFFVGQKLHSTIVAVMNRVPSIMIEYRPKCRDFMASVGLEDYVTKSSDLSLETFLRLRDNLLKNKSSLMKAAEVRMLKYKQQQFKEAKRLVSTFS